MTINIVTDSSCDLYRLPETGGAVRYTSIPFVFTIGNRQFVDDDQLPLEEMIDAMEHEKTASHSGCPSPAAWMEAFSQEGDVIAITISGALSGSYSSACAARDMLLETMPEKRITVINSVSAGAGLVLLVHGILKEVAEGQPYEEIVARCRRLCARKRTVFALCSFDNLVKNGRIPRLVGFVARRLGFWGIGVGTDQGEIEIKGKVRGKLRAMEEILKDMRAWGKPVSRVVITQCQNLEMAQSLKTRILSHWPGAAIDIQPTRGLCSYYAERHGLIVSYA